MNRKSLAIISVLLGISIIAAATVLTWNSLGIKSLLSFSKASSEDSSNAKQTAASTQASATQPVSDAAVIIASKEIPVDNNTLEFDLKVNIHENSKKQTFLAFEYYYNGNEVLKEFDNQQLPEIDGIFERADSSVDTAKGNRVKSVYLNRKYSSAYVILEGSTDSSGTDTAIYDYSLGDLTIKKIFSARGNFSDIGFTKDGSYMSFSLDFPNPADSTKMNSAALNVIKCDTDEFVVSQNRNKTGQPIGKPAKGEQTGYAFVSWFANTIVKIRPVSGISPESKKSADILYDVTSDSFLNPDGTVPASKSDNAGRQTAQESEAVKTLKSFYNYLSTAQYEKAYDLMDSKFQLNAFKEFGAIELDKSDISISDFSTYGMFFQSGRIRNIVKDDISGNTATVYYYQVVSLDQGDQEQAMVATLKKTVEGWKVSVLDAGDINEAPFKQ